MKVYIPNTGDESCEESIRMSDAIINPEHEDDNRLYGPFNTVEEMWRSIFDDED